MSIAYRFDHIHLLSRDPKATADYYRKMFDARVIEGFSRDGKPRIDLDLNGLNIFIFKVEPEEDLPSGPSGRYLGLDHFGLIVDDLDATVAELKWRGAEFATEPCTVGPGLKIVYIRAPENVRIEVLQRS
jgi:lactoylglutathione lyase